jgi:molybdate transport system substrate-binding protein
MRCAMLVILALCCAGPTSGQLTVAAAANTQFAMEELRASFAAATGTEVKAIYGASGKLTTQIKNGAPFDVFVSADMSYPDSLRKWGYAVAAPRVYAYGVLVLWTLSELDLSKGLSVLGDPSVHKIALGDLKTTVYGPAAVAAMKKADVYDAVRSKFVFGESVSQVAQYIASRSADIGFNAKSVVLANEMKGKGTWVEVDRTLYEPLAQGVVICRYGQDNNPKLSSAFYDFLFSDKARDILTKYGYELPKAGP